MLSLQLQKSPAADFEEKCGNSPDISKGFSQSGMSKFESSHVSQAVVCWAGFSQETREWAVKPGSSAHSWAAPTKSLTPPNLSRTSETEVFSVFAQPRSKHHNISFADAPWFQIRMC